MGIFACRIGALCRDAEEAGWDNFTQRVPSHCGIPDHERADFLAAAAHAQIPSMNIDGFVETRTIIQRVYLHIVTGNQKLGNL